MVNIWCIYRRSLEAFYETRITFDLTYLILGLKIPSYFFNRKFNLNFEGTKIVLILKIQIDRLDADIFGISWKYWQDVLIKIYCEIMNTFFLVLLIFFKIWKAQNGWGVYCNLKILILGALKFIYSQQKLNSPCFHTRIFI